jgi:23S rRNA pseudouridine2605 synthase
MSKFKNQGDFQEVRSNNFQLSFGKCLKIAYFCGPNFSSLKDKRPSSPRGRKPSSSSSPSPYGKKRESSPRSNSLSGAFPWKNKSDESASKPARKRIKREAGPSDFSRSRSENPNDSGEGFKKEGGDFKPAFDKKSQANRPNFRREGDRDSKPGYHSREGDSKPGYRSREGDSKPGFRAREGDSKPEFRNAGDRPYKPKFPSKEREQGSDSRGRGERDFKSDRPTERRDSRPAFKKEGSRDFKPRFSERNEGDKKPAFRKSGDRDFKPRFDRGEDRPNFRKEGERKTEFSREKREGAEGRTDRKPKEISNSSRLGKQSPTQYKQFRKNNFAPGDGKAPDYELKGLQKNPRLRGKLKKEEGKEEEEIRLNRFISQSGLCSRREADVLISTGQITVNGKVVDQMGYKVRKDDVIKYGKRILNREKLVYVLLNKPKDFLTTTEDPEERKTVMQLVESACKERIYPVGRLDRNTTGLLLITNDGELSEKLMHPSHNIKKIYQVDLDRPITQADEAKIREGVTLEDGFAPVDELEVLSLDRKILGISIHLGRNRIVRRIFESLEYKVEKLDRVMYAGLTKKDLPRGNWRYLTEKEVINLKYFS